jgi:hypothetical protein
LAKSILRTLEKEKNKMLPKIGVYRTMWPIQDNFICKHSST